MLQIWVCKCPNEIAEHMRVQCNAGVQMLVVNPHEHVAPSVHLTALLRLSALERGDARGVHVHAQPATERLCIRLDHVVDVASVTGFIAPGWMNAWWL